MYLNWAHAQASEYLYLAMKMGRYEEITTVELTGLESGVHHQLKSSRGRGARNFMNFRSYSRKDINPPRMRSHRLHPISNDHRGRALSCKRNQDVEWRFA